MRWTLLLAWAAAPQRTLASSCGSHLSCIAECLRAGGEECGSLRCSSEYQRCDCGNGTMLRADGTCDEAAAVSDVACDPQFSVIFNIATLPSPELPPEAVAAGNVSVQMAAWLQRVVGSSLGYSSQEVAVADMHIGKSEAAAMYMDGSGLVHFDLSFVFCTTEELVEIDWREFEHRFRLELQRYETFQLATMSILRYDVLKSNSSHSSNTTAAPLMVGHLGDAWPSPAVAGGRQDANTRGTLMVFLTCCMTLLGIATMIAVAVFVRSRRRSKIEAGDSGLYPDGLVEPGSRFLATATSAFRPEDVEHGEAFTEAWLGLDTGDIVEVVAGSGGWLYGRVLAHPERVGLFPENSVSWMGVIADGGALDGCELPILEPGCVPAACAPPAEAGTEGTKLAGECHESWPELASGSGEVNAVAAGPGAEASTLAAQCWLDAGATDDASRPPLESSSRHEPTSTIGHG